MATGEQVEEAQAALADAARQGLLLSLGDALVRLGYLTATQYDHAVRLIAAQQAGGIQQLGQYKLLRKLGEGAMGAVFLAEDTYAARQVALKVISKKHARDAEFLTRFRREAKAAGRLNHVNIVGAYTVGEDLGQCYLVMEYCDGEALDAALKRDHHLSWEKAVEIVMQAARGLQHAHEHALVHRDIKPANVIVTTAGVAKILDMGLSKDVSGGTQSFNTATGMALGTPHYISPEQARGDKTIDGRADIYSLGATFYHLVTGETPFHGSTATAVILKHLSEQLPNPQDINPEIPDSVVHVIQNMMAKEPDDRYPDCRALLADLELVIDGKMPSSQAIEWSKSSVAMRRVPVAAPQRAGSGRYRAQAAAGEPRQAPAGAHPLRGTEKHESVQPRGTAQTRQGLQEQTGLRDSGLGWRRLGHAAQRQGGRERPTVLRKRLHAVGAEIREQDRKPAGTAAGQDTPADDVRARFRVLCRNGEREGRHARCGRAGFQAPVCGPVHQNP